MYSKREVMDYIWQYSHFYHSCLMECEKLYMEENGFSSIMVLFNCLENVAKSVVDDYDSNLYTIFKKLREKGLVTEKEYVYLNEGEYCVRKIRNLYAHTNVASINFVERLEGREILCPLTENETSLQIYSKLSPILFNLMIKIVSSNFIDSVREKFQTPLDDMLDDNILEYRKLTYKELLVLKGYPEEYIPQDIDMRDEAKFRLVDNSPDLNMRMRFIPGLIDALLGEDGDTQEQENNYD